MTTSAPIDRPRGLRRTAAVVVAVTALAPLAVIRFAAGDSSSGGGTIGRAEIDYTLGELSASTIAVSVLLALMLAVAAAGIWAARARRVLALTVAVGLAGAVTTAVVAERQSGSDPVSAAESRAVPLGIHRGELEDRLGRPAGSGTARTPELPGVELECAVYPGQAVFQKQMFCFHRDRLALKVGG